MWAHFRVRTFITSTQSTDLMIQGAPEGTGRKLPTDSLSPSAQGCHKARCLPGLKGQWSTRRLQGMVQRLRSEQNKKWMLRWLRGHLKPFFTDMREFSDANMVTSYSRNGVRLRGGVCCAGPWEVSQTGFGLASSVPLTMSHNSLNFHLMLLS